MILPHMRNISEYDKRISTLLHTRAKLRKFWKEKTFQWEVDFHLLQSYLEKDQLQVRQQKKGDNTPTCDFGIKHVKEESHVMTGAAF